RSAGPAQAPRDSRPRTSQGHTHRATGPTSGRCYDTPAAGDRSSSSDDYSSVHEQACSSYKVCRVGDEERGSGGDVVDVPHTASDVGALGHPPTAGSAKRGGHRHAAATNPSALGLRTTSAPSAITIATALMPAV